MDEQMLRYGELALRIVSRSYTYDVSAAPPANCPSDRGTIDFLFFITNYNGHVVAKARRSV